MPTTEQSSMINRVISWSVSNQLLVILLAIAVALTGWLSIKSMPLDAIPDVTDTQVIVRSEFPGQSPQLVEDLVTYPLSSAMLGLPKVEDVRGFSMFGSSFVCVVFEDGIDQYWARSRVLEALNRVDGNLPEGVSTQMGPDATGVGWILQYVLEDSSGQHDLSDLRALQDWFVRFELAAVSGVAEVASVGGFQREYQIQLDPIRMRHFSVSLNEIQMAVRSANQDVGGRLIEQGEMEWVIRSRGYLEEISDFETILVKTHDQKPVYLSDVARVQTGPALRRGVTELNGEGEVVSGIVVMRTGENAVNVIRSIKEKIVQIEAGLPKGVSLKVVYDRSELITQSVDYLSEKLVQEAIVVGLVCLLFLLHLRSAFVAIITLPLGVLAALTVMSWQGITANIMSLGGIAIAIGAMVDASIVMVENVHRKLAGQAPGEDQTAIKLKALKEVGPGLFFSLLIITASFLPVLALTGESYRLFSPLAYTKTYAMAFAAFFSVTIVPVLVMWLVRGKIRHETDNPLNRLFIAMYRPILSVALKFPAVTLILLLIAGASVIYPYQKLGSEFMPALYEGELLYMPTTLPGVSVTKAKELLATTNRLIKEHPEVDQVYGKLGRADTATDPAPVSMIETWVKLKPADQWRPGITIQSITRELDQSTKIPGLVNSWGYPIKIRMDMISTGIRTPVGIKISGEDLSVIESIALEIEAAVKEIPGTRSAFADRVQGGKYLDIQPDRERMALYGVDFGEFQMHVKTALGGQILSEMVKGRERYPILLRYAPEYRESPEQIKQIEIPTKEGGRVSLGSIATIAFVEGPPMIKSENARLNGWVFVDVVGQDLGSYVANAREQVNQMVDLPAGYAVEWSGQFEQLEEANERLTIAIPAAIAIIAALLLLHFGNLNRPMMVMLSLPFGLIGGVWGLYLADYDLSVAVAVGFIALGGVAAETAVVMLLYIDQQLREQQPSNRRGVIQAIQTGAVMRVRPKLMTVLTILLGLAPIFFTQGVGSDVMTRIAMPMFGGMVSTTILTLIVIPVVCMLYERSKYPNEA